MTVGSSVFNWPRILLLYNATVVHIKILPNIWPACYSYNLYTENWFFSQVLHYIHWCINLPFNFSKQKVSVWSDWSQTSFFCNCLIQPSWLYAQKVMRVFKDCFFANPIFPMLSLLLCPFPCTTSPIAMYLFSTMNLSEKGTKIC